MAQVSKYPLSKETEERIFEVFWQTIADLKSKEIVQKFLEDLLSPTEKTMLAKRLAIAILLTKGHDYRSISKTLKVSTATIMIVNTWLKHGGEGYKMVIEKLLKQEKSDEFWDNLEETVSKILPPRYGTNWSEKRQEQYQRLRASRRKRSTL